VGVTFVTSAWLAQNPPNFRGANFGPLAISCLPNLAKRRPFIGGGRNDKASGETIHSG
jgi:hypothetical protein